MTDKQNGGPAFPTESYDVGRKTMVREEGMTLRDYFAAKALQGMLAGEGGDSISNDKLSEWAYMTADAMLKARVQ